MSISLWQIGAKLNSHGTEPAIIHQKVIHVLKPWIETSLSVASFSPRYKHHSFSGISFCRISAKCQLETRPFPEGGSVTTIWRVREPCVHRVWNPGTYPTQQGPCFRGHLILWIASDLMEDPKIYCPFIPRSCKPGAGLILGNNLFLSEAQMAPWQDIFIKTGKWERERHPAAHTRGFPKPRDVGGESEGKTQLPRAFCLACKCVVRYDERVSKYLSHSLRTNRGLQINSLFMTPSLNGCLKSMATNQSTADSKPRACSIFIPRRKWECSAVHTTAQQIGTARTKPEKRHGHCKVFNTPNRYIFFYFL